MTENTKLNFLLVDDGELGGGMYLASAYNQEIYVQEAKPEDLVKFNDKIQSKLILCKYLFFTGKTKNEINSENFFMDYEDSL